jgi:ABC-type multidrug transport system permease subunit
LLIAGITVFLNLLFGLIFRNAGNRDDTQEGFFYDHFGALTMVTISSMFGAAQPTLLAFPEQRPIFLREYSTGTYSIMPYFISKVCFEVPLAFVQTLVQWLVVYWLIAFQGNFILLLLASFSLALASASIAVLMGCAVADVKTATELMPVIFVPQMLFAGFFVSTDQIPSYLRWAQYLCSLKYAMNLLSIIEFGESACQSGADMQCKALLDSNEIDEDKWWAYILVLAALFAGFRIIGAYVLTVKATTVF